jgi:hypothetical protein
MCFIFSPAVFLLTPPVGSRTGENCENARWPRREQLVGNFLSREKLFHFMHHVRRGAGTGNFSASFAKETIPPTRSFFFQWH